MNFGEVERGKRCRCLMFCSILSIDIKLTLTIHLLLYFMEDRRSIKVAVGKVRKPRMLHHQLSIARMNFLQGVLQRAAAREENKVPNRNHTKKRSTKNGVLKRRKILLGKWALQRNSSETNSTE